jgi:hypothetical protein
MYKFYITNGKDGHMTHTGSCTEPVVEGLNSEGEYVYPGEPSENYIKKKSEFDVWDSSQRCWVKNPSEEALIVEREERELEKKKSLIKAQRNQLLLKTDWTQLPDVPLDTKEIWAEYRQALRDVTDQPTFPHSVVWPTTPN